MEDIKSDFVVITNNKIKLFSESDECSVQPLYDDIFENVTIHFNDNGSITLYADKIEYEFLFEDTYPENLDYEIDESEISKTWFRKRPIVRTGWHRKLKTKPIEYIINNYIIIK